MLCLMICGVFIDVVVILIKKALILILHLYHTICYNFLTRCY